MMKNRFFNFWFVPLLLAAVACSEISEEERLVYVAPVEASRKVLIEDFTGQKCINCPLATEVIHKMQEPEAYGDNVIPVAIHCGPFGIANTNPATGLMTDDGKEYWNHWFSNSQGQPVAMINRGEATNDYTNWPMVVASAIQLTTDVNIALDAKYDSVSCKITVAATLSATDGKSAKVQVWLTEDNIVARQQMPDNKTNREYVHNHVFRSTMNGLWGEDINFGKTESLLTWSIDAQDYWKPADMHAIVFVYDESGVLQAEQTNVVINN